MFFWLVVFNIHAWVPSSKESYAMWFMQMSKEGGVVDFYLLKHCSKAAVNPTYKMLLSYLLCYKSK